jgi:hypothetical protein
MHDIHKRGITWYLLSIGPSHDVTASELRWLGGQSDRVDAAPTYDATNETVSLGYIYRTSAGIPQGVPPVLAVSSNRPAEW